MSLYCFISEKKEKVKEVENVVKDICSKRMSWSTAISMAKLATSHLRKRKLTATSEEEATANSGAVSAAKEEEEEEKDLETR